MLGLAALVVLALLVWFGGRAYLSQSAPVYSGSFQVAGLSDEVEITFDAMGIPNVWAETDHDAYFALGWLHASERLFQMETARRMATGTLSELFGEMAFRTDVRQRQIGFHRIALRAEGELDPAVRLLLDAYVSGINSQMESQRVRPPEFVLLRHRPRPWTLDDVLALFVYQTWYPTELSDRMGPNRRLVDALGDEVAGLLAAHRPWSIPSVPEASIEAQLAARDLPVRMTMATNNWVVGPQSSASGFALHAADPHLAIHGIPGFWYAVGLHSRESGSTIGVSAPGVPVIAMGHNGQVAWSFSVAPVVVVDHFLESFHPQDSTLVMTPGGFSPVEVIHEEVSVSGEDEPRIVAVEHTPRGVLIERRGTVGTSIYWTGFDHFLIDGVEASLRIPSARDFGEFRELVATLPTFSVNWIYSDRSGNIGYQLGTAIPDRAHDAFLIADAADAEVVHGSVHPFEAQPWSLNPDQGWLATTNNPPAPAEWTVDIPGNYNHLRMQRVANWLDGRTGLSRNQMEEMQRDFVSSQALQWRTLMSEGAEILGEASVAERIRSWDGSMAPDDRIASMFAFWWAHLTRHLFEDRLGDGWRDASILREIVLFEDLKTYINDTRTFATETVQEISARAMADALRDADGRPWGEVQQLEMRHPLTQMPLLDRWLRLNRGPFPRGGHLESLNLTASAWRESDRSFSAQVAPSLRFVLDWADVDGFTLELPLGQSGSPFSPHYDDFLALNERDERWNLPKSREAIAARTRSTLRLSPRR